MALHDDRVNVVRMQHRAMNAKLSSPSVISGCRQTGLVKLRLKGDLHTTVSRFHVKEARTSNSTTPCSPMPSTVPENVRRSKGDARPLEHMQWIHGRNST